MAKQKIFWATIILFLSLPFSGLAQEVTINSFSKELFLVKPGDIVTSVFEINNQSDKACRYLIDLPRGISLLSSTLQEVISPHSSLTLPLSFMIGHSLPASQLIKVKISILEYRTSREMSSRTVSFKIKPVEDQQIIIPAPILSIKPGVPFSFTATLLNTGNKALSGEIRLKVPQEWKFQVSPEFIRLGARKRKDFEIYIIIPVAYQGPQSQAVEIQFFKQEKTLVESESFQVQIEKTAELPQSYYQLPGAITLGMRQDYKGNNKPWLGLNLGGNIGPCSVNLFVKEENDINNWKQGKLSKPINYRFSVQTPKYAFALGQYQPQLGRLQFPRSLTGVWGELSGENYKFGSYVGRDDFVTDNGYWQAGSQYSRYFKGGTLSTSLTYTQENFHLDDEQAEFKTMVIGTNLNYNPSSWFFLDSEIGYSSEVNSFDQTRERSMAARISTIFNPSSHIIWTNQIMHIPANYPIGQNDRQEMRSDLSIQFLETIHIAGNFLWSRRYKNYYRMNYGFTGSFRPWSFFNTYLGFRVEEFDTGTPKEKHMRNNLTWQTSFVKRRVSFFLNGNFLQERDNSARLVERRLRMRSTFQVQLPQVSFFLRTDHLFHKPRYQPQMTSLNKFRLFSRFSIGSKKQFSLLPSIGYAIEKLPDFRSKLIYGLNLNCCLNPRYSLSLNTELNQFLNKPGAECRFFITFSYHFNAPVPTPVRNYALSFERANSTGFVFKDDNMNLKYDSGEEMLSNVEFDFDGKKTRSNKKGIFYFPESESPEIKVDQSTLPVNYTAHLNAPLPEKIEHDMVIPVVRGASIQGTVYYDDNKNKIPDLGEKLSSGISFRLTDSQKSSQIVSSTSGEFSFLNIVPGDYTIEIVEAYLPQSLTSVTKSKNITLEPGQRLNYFAAVSTEQKKKIVFTYGVDKSLTPSLLEGPKPHPIHRHTRRDKIILGWIPLKDAVRYEVYIGKKDDLTQNPSKVISADEAVIFLSKDWLQKKNLYWCVRGIFKQKEKEVNGSFSTPKLIEINMNPIEFIIEVVR